MELRKVEGGWYLDFLEGSVQLIQVDFRLGLLISDAPSQAKLFIETPCFLRGPSGVSLLTPAKSASLAPILSFFNAPVRSIAIRKTGRLALSFGDGTLLEVEPDDAYEAWQLGGSGSFLLICSPGGEVSAFLDKRGDSALIGADNIQPGE